MADHIDEVLDRHAHKSIAQLEAELIAARNSKTRVASKDVNSVNELINELEFILDARDGRD